MTDADEIKSLREKCQQLNESEKRLKEAFRRVLSIAIDASFRPNAIQEIKKLAEDELGIVNG